MCFLLSKLFFSENAPRKIDDIMFLLRFYGNKKGAQRNSEQFGGSSAPRSLF